MGSPRCRGFAGQRRFVRRSRTACSMDRQREQGPTAILANCHFLPTNICPPSNGLGPQLPRSRMMLTMPRRGKPKRRRPPGDECVIPPAMPPETLGQFVFGRAEHEERASVPPARRVAMGLLVGLAEVAEHLGLVSRGRRPGNRLWELLRAGKLKGLPYLRVGRNYRFDLAQHRCLGEAAGGSGRTERRQVTATPARTTRAGAFGLRPEASSEAADES
jgi:hypothetical protein